MKAPYPLLWLCLVGGLLAGCASKKDLASDRKDKDEYIYVTPTGSNIPVRVKKSDLEAAQGPSQVAQDALREVQKRGAAEHRGD